MKALLTIQFLIILLTASQAQVDSVSISKNNLLVSKLKEGKSSYAVWSKNTTDGTVSQLSIWNREVVFLYQGSKKLVAVKQTRWYNDPKRNKYVYTLSDRTTLQTIYDYTTRGDVVEAFNYTSTGIVGADSIKDNSKSNFNLAVKDAPFCFEMDLETLPLLPIKRKGQKLAINFYHPGGASPPKYYPVEVLAIEEITLTDGHVIECWKIRLQYAENSFDLSWINTHSREIVKLEGHYGNTIFNKVKLNLPALP